ncbi:MULTISPECIES: HNH endonuclease [unclassified Agrobacterium]|uniref:HNH endonuclease n=1 Tax=unclassified Agrobacterium TaxID=2632611 RepID=UPI000B69AE43|nr:MULTISPECIES: HNH endonuclease [unclassified Agrobacterium]SNB61986.1 TIGR02646 family protein [Agrobacterium sp. 719_389]
MVPVHAKKPVRRAVVTKKDKYKDYRSELRQDFNGCCGYCDDSDDRLDPILFHIDHFAPKSKFAALETTYSNLVYACRFCNIRKSNHWVGVEASIHNDGEKGFVDPCDPVYDIHLSRNENGRISGETPLGKYVAKRLNLGLLRHEMLWRARRTRAIREKISQLIDAHKASGSPDDPNIELLKQFYDLTTLIEGYEYSALNA